MKTTTLIGLCMVMVLMCGTMGAEELSPFPDADRAAIERAIFDEMCPVVVSNISDGWEIRGMHFNSTLKERANGVETWGYEEKGKKISFVHQKTAWDTGLVVAAGAFPSKGVVNSEAMPVKVAYDDAIKQSAFGTGGINVKIVQDNYRWQKIIEIESLESLGNIPTNAEYLEISFLVFDDFGIPNGIIEKPILFGENSYLQPIRAWDSSEDPTDSGAFGVVTGNVITKRIPVAWLKDAVYPVRTDLTITYGAENVFDSATSSSISVASLDSTHFVVTYKDEGNSNYGTAIVGVISGTTISSYGAEHVFNSAITYDTSVAALDNTHFVVVYRDDGNSNYGTAIVGVISGTTISSYGAENVFNSANTIDNSVAALDSTHFVVTYKDDGGDDYGCARIGIISGTTISSYGAENVFNSAITQYIFVVALDSTHFVVAYQDGGNSNYGTAIVGVISGTTISSYGAEHVFNSANTIDNSVAALDSTHFVVTYKDDGGDDYGCARIGIISGTTISSYGAENVFKSAAIYRSSVAALDSTHFVVAYGDVGNSYFGTAIIGEFSGTTISSYGAENVFNSGTTYAVAVARLDDAHFVVAYPDGGNSNYGTAIVGEAAEPTPTYIPPNPTTLANTTGNFWVNHTWAAGSGNVTDSYNVSQNGTWTNTSANLYFNATDVGAHGYSDVTVWAWNSSGSGTLSAGSIAQNTTVPNNAIVISDVSSSYSILEGETLSIDANYTDADGDTGTFADNSTEWNVNSGTGIVSWVTVDGDQGTYGWLINVSDGYGSTSTQEFVVTVTDSTPTSVSNMANATGNFWINWTWDAGANVDDYDVWIDEVDIGADITNLYYNHSASAHANVNISVRSHNHTLPAYSAWVNDTMTVPNNAITITNTSDQNVNEGQNIYVDYDATDADSDAPAFSCNRTDLFADFSTSTGKGNWTTGYTDADTYYIDFGVSDGYGSTSNYTMTITVADFGTPGTPTGLANTTGNFWVNHTWTSGANTDTFNVSVNTVWYNNTAVAYNNTTVSAHAWVNITLAGYNNTSCGLSAFASQNTQIPNNPITITNTTDWSGDEGQTVYVDYDATDADSDSPTFSCNRTDMFTDFDTANGTGNWTATAGTHYIDFGVSDGYSSTDNYTMTITVSAPPISITLHSVSPDIIQTNYTGVIQVNYIVESPNPLNLSTLALLYGINYTTTGDMHSYIAPPPNSIASEGIYRAPYRNTTPHLSWENNATITDGNVWQWGGGDNDSTWITVTPINATHTWINATGQPEQIFQGSFYIGRRAMDSSPKTGFEINSQQGLIIKMWDNEAIRGRSINYLMNMYFDSDWESTIPTSPIEIWGLNSSFNPDTDDPTTSGWGAKIVEWDGDRWVNHSWIPDANASYSRPLVLDASSFPVIPDEVNYIYLKSDTQSSKSYILNATNYDPGICNITYAQTETMWTYSELADVSTQVAYTPSFFTTFVRDDEQFLHHLYIADDLGEWVHSDINNISIGVSHYPVDPPSFEYFNISCPAIGYDLDTRMDATYNDGSIYIGVYCHADPDGGIVSHNITIHYVNGTIAGIINDTFTTTTPGLVEINFSTTPHYSTTDGYILKCVSTDDEGNAATTWLDSFFTLAADGTQGYYVDDYLMFWGMNDIPTLYATIANDSLISYNAGSNIYTMHVPFFKSKCNETFRFNETVHLKSLNTDDVAYFRFSGETIFDNANIHGWNTVTDTVAPDTDVYRGYVFSCCRITGNITNSNLSYLGSDVYRQEGLNFIDNTASYIIHNTTLSHNARGVIMEECENFNISHCNIHDNVEVGIGVYYSDNIVVENSTITDSSYNPCIYLYGASDNIIRYNTIQNCIDYGIQIRSNSNNNIFTGNDVSGSGIYDYYFRASSINNTIRDPATATDKIRCTCSSSVNIENTDNSAFIEDSLNSTYAYPTNFSMMVDSVSQTFDITQQDMTVTPSSDSIRMWNIVWGNSISFNASNVSGVPYVWFNATQSIWANANMSVYRNGTIYYNGSADANGLFTFNYSGGWSGHWFEFVPENIAPDKPTVVVPANGATGTSTNPTLRVLVTDQNGYDPLSVTFYAQGGTQIGSTQTGLANGSTAAVVWSGRSYSTTYYWYAVADDGTAQTQSDTWHFTTQGGSGSGGSSHVIVITGCTDWEGNAGSQVYIDFGCTGETTGATFTTNATNGSIDSSSGVYTWNTATADAGVYTWRFNVENVYTISDYCDVTVTVYHYASPTNLAATTGNFWVNHTWGGNGFMDSYNVSVNDVWNNGSTDQYSYHVTTPHAWSNISVAAFNDTTGLSSFISNDVQVPNNPITLTNYTVLMLATAGDNVTVDMNHEDLDGDTATYHCSRMDLFTDFNTADGTGQYTNAINGTHEVIFGVTDGYGWDNETITIEVGTVHPLELDEETPLILFVVLVVLLFGSLFYIYHAASYVAKVVTALISTWMSFMLSNMAVSGNVVINYAELSSGDAFVYGTHSIQIAALSHFFMFTGVVSALFMLVFAVKLVTDTYLNMQEKRKAEEEWDGVEQ